MIWFISLITLFLNVYLVQNSVWKSLCPASRPNSYFFVESFLAIFCQMPCQVILVWIHLSGEPFPLSGRGSTGEAELGETSWFNRSSPLLSPAEDPFISWSHHFTFDCYSFWNTTPLISSFYSQPKFIYGQFISVFSYATSILWHK